MKATSLRFFLGIVSCYSIRQSRSLVVVNRNGLPTQRSQGIVMRGHTFSSIRLSKYYDNNNEEDDDHGDTHDSRASSSSSSFPESDRFSSIWNPWLRKTMGSIATLGAIETAYLTWTKITGSSVFLCGITSQTGGCNSVLEGPYSFIPGTNIPLSLLGLVAYLAVGFLALGPLVAKLWPAAQTPRINKEEEESNNRLILTALSTAMGVFSVFLMTLLFGVLKESCAFCVASAIFSVSLAALAWFGGAVPSERMKQRIQWSLGSGIVAFLAPLFLFIVIPEMSWDEPSSSSPYFGSATSRSSQWLANYDGGGLSNSLTSFSPPAILSTSSPRAMEISRHLQLLDARMFGAYWCSHCYDQKERLGKEAMSNIPYIECSREGVNSQNAFCGERGVPGYPTWEIKGILYPGEKELAELEEIINSVATTNPDSR